MPHFLNLSQLAEEAARLELDNIVAFLEEAAQHAATAIAAQRRDVEIIDPASMQAGFAGLCVGFGPVRKKQKCPDDFAEYDLSSDWAKRI